MSYHILALIATSAFAWLAFSANAQPKYSLSLEEAVAVAMEHNYDVRIAQKGRKVSDNMAEAGNADLLPSVFIDGAGEFSQQSTNITFAGEGLEPIQADGAQTLGLNGAAVVSYTLFNGGRRIHGLKALQSMSEDARLRERLAMESTILSVAGRYLEALRLRDAYQISAQAVAISLERRERAAENYRFGNFTKLQLLNAEVDLRADSIALAEAETALQQAKRNLQFTMGTSDDSSFDLDSAFAMLPGLDKQTLMEGAISRNTAYLRARNEVYRAEEELHTFKADLFPTLSAQGGYRYNYNDFEANFLRTQENFGWNAGLNLRFFLFDGGRIRRNIENARLNVEMASIEEARILQQTHTLISNAWDTYVMSLKLLAISQRNLALAEANFLRSREAFGSGQITGTELREAQLNLIRNRNEISVRRIRSKLAEVGLLFEAGALLE